MMMTPDLEPLLQPIEEDNEQGIPIEKVVVVQTLETVTSERRAQELPIYAFEMKEVMNDIAEHCEEQENIDEIRDHIGKSFVSEKKKRMQMSPNVVQDIARENSGVAYLENRERAIMIPGVDSTRTSIISAMKDLIRLGHITKRRR